MVLTRPTVCTPADLHLSPRADAYPDLSFASSLASATADHLTATLSSAVDHGVAAQARRLRFAATQMAAALAAAGSASSDGSDLDGLWRAAQRRLAVLPASRPLANAPIAGVS